MGDNSRLRPKGEEGGGSKSAIKIDNKGRSILVVKGRKKRRWVNPKDKSVARKAFLKVRDAKARSQFSKLQKKAREGAGYPVDCSLPTTTVDDNNAFLEKLMDPFSHFKPEERNPPAEHTNSKGPVLERRKTTLHQGSEQSVTMCGTSETARRMGSRRTLETDSNHSYAGGRGHSETTVKELKTRKLTSREGDKGYVPFIRAKREFEAKQREREAHRLSQQADAEKEMIRRREKKRLDKLAHRKLQARTTKGQPVMGNLVDVLLLKMQKKHQ